MAAAANAQAAAAAAAAAVAASGEIDEWETPLPPAEVEAALARESLTPQYAAWELTLQQRLSMAQLRAHLFTAAAAGAAADAAAGVDGSGWQCIFDPALAAMSGKEADSDTKV
jgi:hypothetical protein